LNVAAGINTVLNFADSGAGGAAQPDGDNLQSAPENINVIPAPVLVNGGTTLVVVDPTGFAASSQFIGDLSNSLHNTLDRNIPTVSGQGSTSGPGDDALSQEAFNSRFWISGFGGESDVEGVGNITDIEHDFVGIASGIEIGAYSDGIWGVFGGAADSGVSLQFQQGTLDVDTVLGGLYYKRDFGDFRVNAAFAVGNTSNEMTRIVNGVQAAGDFDGWFYSPSLTLEAPLGLFSLPESSISGRVSYTNHELDGYTETGAAAGPLTIGDRDLSVLGLRGQVSFPETTVSSDGSAATFGVNFGVDAQFYDGDNVNATVNIGAPTSFNFAADLDDRVSGFVGVDVALTSADGMSTLSFSGEIQSDFDNNDDQRSSGEVRATFRF